MNYKDYHENDKIDSVTLIELMKELVSAHIREEVDCDLIEVFVVLTGGARATHFMYIEDDIIYDEGIDGETNTCSPEEFIKEYEKYPWIISQLPYHFTTG